MGLAAGADPEPGSAGLSSLPAALGSAAYQLVASVAGPGTASSGGDNKPGVSYSEVAGGVNPTSAALGIGHASKKQKYLIN